ncbi:putative sensor histidine kinase/response regulator [Aspergillus undulatus]|uniref:putative sensor histidine kinase/response regulator n=1 Tax=Aspergillus undulatus TaxID=1810928 RepID=UPI003CCDC40E
MGEVHSMRTSPLPSPVEASSPVAAPQSHHCFFSQAFSSFSHDEDNAYTVGGIFDSRDDFWKANSLRYCAPPEQIANLHRIPASAKKENLDARSGLQEDLGRNQPTLKDIRRQMEDLLAYQQMRSLENQASSTPQETASSLGSVSSVSQESTKKRRISNVLSPQVIPSVTGAPDSAGSSGTIRGTDSQTTPDALPDRTPSYPFPEMPSQTTKQKFFQLNNGSFKLTLPAEKLKSPVAPSQIPVETQPAPGILPASSNVFLPPDHKPVPEDPAYSSPNLYELTLQLNADPGLDSWWANLIQILRTHYGVERASLAVPGDSTDLENVPWGQKAVFNDSIPETDQQPPSSHNADAASGAYSRVSAASNVANEPTTTASSVARPPLFARHSFAGFGKERKKPAWNDRDALLESSGSVKLDTSRKQGISENRTPVQTVPVDNSEFSQQNDRLSVFPTPRALEVESDPLIKRTGVAKLFGRTKPVILTREYSHASAFKQPHDIPVQTPEDKVQVTPTAEPSHATANSTVAALQPDRHHLMEFLDEYEQIPPSPWSQSPAPSPAPRGHPEQNPFFSNHTVDESAFAKHPPLHDYSNPDPLEAIGVDLAKSVIHIPLLHAGPSQQSVSSPLRFPVAVISILSPVIPYPSNLRQSLAYLMPHLTTSFCLAQHYSQLERQFASRLEAPRFGNLLGLGGTFSDESSELELVAGLSGHVSYTVTDDGSLSARASLSSPDERASSARFSPSLSALGTPYLDSNPAAPTSVNVAESPGLASRYPAKEPVDSYFNVPRSKSLRENAGQTRNRLAKMRQAAAATSPSAISPGRTRESLTQDPSITVGSPLEMKPPPLVSPTQASSRHHSNNSFYAQLQRELPRPFNDTVAQLMLNSIPLHIFLAKPQSGEVIWTNSKFDAFRQCQPQEQRSRDPWQGLHDDDRESVAAKWANALLTGSQFTERVRVKRWNDEATYRWFIFRANPLLSSTAEVLYWIGSFLDIHDQHVVELKAAQEREKFAIDAKYRAFSNSVPQIVFEATECRGLIFVNEQWHLYTGQTLEDALNFGFAKHVHHDDLEKCGLLSLYLASGSTNDNVPVQSSEQQSESLEAPTKAQDSRFGNRVTPALDKLVKRGVASVQKDENGRVFYSTEIRLTSRGGDFRWHLVRLVRVETSSFGSGEASWYGTCTDINDRKNLEKELNKAMQQLNNQMESKTKFFSNMSHEIRTPLNGILGTIPFILDTSLDTDQRRMLDTIQISSTNLRELVDNILDVSRVEAGKMSLVSSWFHVRSVIEDVIDTVSSRAIDKGLEMNYLMDVDVPPMVVGDRFRLRQILINLVGNAVKFTAQGEIYIRCSIYHDSGALTEPTEILLNFDVVDTGKGFSAQDAERLMQRFSQLGQNASQQNAGSGLGLFLSKQLVEMHGGRLTPSSKEGQGAKFSFHVKVDAPPPPAPGDVNFVRETRAPSKTSSFQKLFFSSKDSMDSKTPEAVDPSPALELPLSQPPNVLELSARLGLGTSSTRSSFSSALPTPDLHNVDPMTKVDINKPLPNPPETSSSPTSAAATEVEVYPEPLKWQDTYSIVILCPLEHTRESITQHIEQVVPHEIQHSITSFPDVEDWKDSSNFNPESHVTHLVLNLPNTDDVSEVINWVAAREPEKAPTLVFISDLYQKWEINGNIKQLASSGRHIFTVPKPVKPSAFSPIFDPDNRRDLSKDRNQDMARAINNNFKTMSKMVKEVIGNKGYRVLLVEDDETNRMVMMKYLDKIKVMAETAADGQQCTDMVFSKEPGYYSLIICDIQMPIKNGYETCRDIRAWESRNHYPQIPIMALSANAMTDQIQDAAHAGFNDYVTKPIKHNELGKMMMGLLDPGRPLLLLRDRLREGDEASRRTG